jgi:hypothetical protein
MIMNTTLTMTTKHEQAHSITGKDRVTSDRAAGSGSGRMRRSARSVAAVAALTVMSSAGADARAATLPDTKRDEYVNTYLSVVRDHGFSESKVGKWKRTFPLFNWTTNACEGTIKDPATRKYFAVFFWPCAQHDFGYRNNDLVGHHDDRTRNIVDSEFLERMNAVCSRPTVIRKKQCRGVAKKLYDAAHSKGIRAWNADTNDPWY